MRRLELSSPLDASADEAWATLLDLDGWSRWGRLVVSAQGEFVAGSRWTMELVGHGGRKKRTMRPWFVAIQRPSIRFETRLIAGWAVTLRHEFEVQPTGPSRSVLHQRFEAEGLLLPMLWAPIHRGMAQFQELGDDLARHLGAP